jgi:hypothetical protein
MPGWQAKGTRNGTRWSAVDAACMVRACTPISRAPATLPAISRPRHRRPSRTPRAAPTGHGKGRHRFFSSIAFSHDRVAFSNWQVFLFLKKELLFCGLLALASNLFYWVGVTVSHQWITKEWSIYPAWSGQEKAAMAGACSLAKKRPRGQEGFSMRHISITPALLVVPALRDQAN